MPRDFVPDEDAGPHVCAGMWVGAKKTTMSPLGIVRLA